MSDRLFSTFAYRHGDSFAASPARRLAVALVVVLVAGVPALAVLWPAGLVLLVGALAALAIGWAGRGPEVGLIVGPRFVVCGKTLLYYRGLRLVEVLGDQQLRLTGRDGATLAIFAERFPTNARKPDKVAAHRAKKFAKARAKILARVRTCAPDVAIRGAP